MSRIASALPRPPTIELRTVGVWALLLLLLLLLLLAAGCGRKGGGPRYASVDELEGCRANECVEAELSFRHWANAEYFRGRMIYHCDPGSELDGRPDPAITRLIFVVHGVVGTTPEKAAEIHTPPGLYQLRYVNLALRRAQELDPELDPETIAIIAPTFQRTERWQPYTDENKRVWTWAGTTWNTGKQAEPRETFTGIVRAEAVSSFDLFDEFLRAALIKFPNLRQIVVVGHSAGGQAVHRYAMLGVGVHEHIEAEGIHVRYVPANPGTYAFPLQVRKLPPGQSGVRPGPGRGDTLDWHWAAPRGCEGYDRWGFGLEGVGRDEEARTMRAANYAIENYLRPVDRKLARKAMRDVGGRDWATAARVALRLQYASREIWHIQSATDTEGTFGTNCRSTLQGRSRFERFSNFQESWTRLVDVQAPNLHFVTLENVDPHGSRSVYTSDAGVHVLFY